MLIKGVLGGRSLRVGGDKKLSWYWVESEELAQDDKKNIERYTGGQDGGAMPNH